MHRNFSRYAWGLVAFNILVILWGTFVRATGSGAGCGSHWPLCNGEVMLRSPAIATIIEFTHRMMSGADLILVAGLVMWAYRAFPKGHIVRRGAVLSMAFLMTEALIGAGLVLLEHVALNASTSRAWSLSAHLLNTLSLLACLTLTAYWSGGGAPPRKGRLGPELLTVAIFAVLGVSGALAALGDTLFPAASLAEGFRQDLSPAAHLFVRLRVLHPFLAVAGSAWMLYFTTRNHAWPAAVLVMAQVLAGGMNVLLLAPVWMQIVHLLLADLLWIALVLLCFTAPLQPRAWPASHPDLP